MTTPDDESARRAELTFTVTASDTAQAVGSGSLPVLGTPRLLAWCEAATCAAAEHLSGGGRTTVGTRAELEHRSASAVGSVVHVVADLVHTDGRLLRFSVAASDRDGRLLATGEITRVVVDADRFLARLPRP
ncbi:MAG TPA: hotdog domain-containing protein [Actinomycetales bacterium]|nr:hotdog domain-containing protein [Actinomycetales bacterium]